MANEGLPVLRIMNCSLDPLEGCAVRHLLPIFNVLNSLIFKSCYSARYKLKKEVGALQGSPLADINGGDILMLNDHGPFCVMIQV